MRDSLSKVKLRSMGSVVLVAAVLGLAFLATPVLAPKSPPQEFLINIDGDVDATPFTQFAANKPATKFEKGASTTLNLDGLEERLRLEGAFGGDFTDPPGLAYHKDFCQPGPDTRTTQLDDSPLWIQGTLGAGSSGNFGIRITIGFDNTCGGIERYHVIIGFTDEDFTTDANGVRTYSTVSAEIKVVHYAEKDDPGKKGKKGFAHQAYTFTMSGVITVTITPCSLGLCPP